MIFRETNRLRPKPDTRGALDQELQQLEDRSQILGHPANVLDGTDVTI